MIMVHIRYKDGRDKLIQMKVPPNFSLPYVSIRQVPHFPPTNNNVIANPMPTIESFYELSPTPPIQHFEDFNGAKHYICITEILDITVEEIDDE